MPLRSKIKAEPQMFEQNISEEWPEVLLNQEVYIKEEPEDEESILDDLLQDVFEEWPEILLSKEVYTEEVPEDEESLLVEINYDPNVRAPIDKHYNLRSYTTDCRSTDDTESSSSELEVKYRPPKSCFSDAQNVPIYVLRPKLVDVMRSKVSISRLSQATISKWTKSRKQKIGADCPKSALRKSRIIFRILHNETLNYSCDICGLIIHSRQTMNTHMRLRHLKDPFLFCDLCPESFRNKKELMKHVRIHTKSVISCQVCGLQGFARVSFNHHMATHAKKTKCKICHKFVAAMKDHLNNSHAPERSMKVPCPICGEKISRYNMRRHVRNFHEKNFPCTHDQCNENFNTKLLLLQHSLKVHYVGKLFECHCGFVAKQISNFSMHKQTHISGVSCKACQRTYKNDLTLRSHWKEKHFLSMGRFPGADRV